VPTAENEPLTENPVITAELTDEVNLTNLNFSATRS
jgi:hypothetical protein